MSIPSSGKVSLADLRTELQSSVPSISLKEIGRPTTGAPGTFQNAVYVPINQSSTAKPDNNAPYSISEWRNYNHSENKPCSGTSFTTPELGGFYTYYRVDITGTAQYESSITITGNSTANHGVYIFTQYPFDGNGNISITPFTYSLFTGATTKYYKKGIDGSNPQVLHFVFWEDFN